MQLLAKSDNAFSELSNDTSVHVAEKEQSAHNSTVNLEPFVSLPATVLSNNTTGLRRLYSAPPVTQESLHTSIPSEIEPLWRGVVSLKTSSFRLVLVTAAASSKTPEGFLMQMSVAANLEFLERTDKIAVNLIQLGVCSLQTNNSSDVYAGASHGTSVRIPQFGSMSISIGGADKIANSLLQSTSLEPAISITEAGIETGANDENNVSKIQDSINSAASPITLSSTSTSNDSFVDHPNCILECLKFTAFLERNTFTNSDSMWSRAWKGSCLLEGMEVVLTTSEIQMLLSLMDPLAEYSSTEKPKFDQSSSLTTSKGLGTESRSVLPEIPDGAIVAVKDAHEHLYISVEETPSIKGHYHLVGVWHYSLAGEKALFKVKYQKNQKKGAIWFSLLSVHAKDAEGEPFRLHFQPGSSVANLVTTNDGSWELWQSVAYKPMEEDLQGLDVNYTKMFNNLVYLINQKSKDSLAFVDGVLMLVRQPGNPFKLRIVANHSQLEMGVLTDLRKGKSSGLTCLTKEQQAVRETMIPQINCKAKTIAFTVLHSVGYGAHLLPLFQISFQDGKAVIQVGGHKVRIFSGCKVHLKHFEAQNSCWLPITNPICTDIVYRIHKVFVHDGHKKSPISFLCRLKKVDVAVSELSLDTCLFLIGALKLAGPYTLRNSPVLANRCQVENRTGVNIVCCFEHEENDQSGKVLAWQTNDFLIRHVLSRRDCSIQKVSSSLTLSLQKPGKGTSTAIQVSLVEPGIVAARTRLQPIQESNCFTGSRMAAGPILVVDKSRKTQDGMFVSISPMVQIHNATGLRLELRCRRPNQGGEGAIVFLEDGDKIDDSMSAFDALDMEGDLRKALASLNLGNYLLSIRPASHISIATSTNYEWSQDVKGSKAVRVSGLFDKLHYRLKTTFKTQGLDSSFETVFCRMKEYETMTRNSSDEIPGKHFIIRTFRRKVPVTKPNTSKQQKSRPSVVAWQEQQEILLLPTIRVQNFLSCSIELILHQSHKDDKKHKTVLEPSNQCENEIVIPSGGSKACIYADINDLFLVVKHIELGLVSKPLSIGSGDNQLHESDGSMKEVEMDVDFKDSVHFATSKVLRADDGILEVIFYSKFQLQNQSNMPLVCCSPMKHSRWRGRREFNNNEELVWQPSGIVTFLSPQSSISWLDRSSRLLLKREEENARVAYLDLESLSGSLEISLGVDTPDNIVDWIQLGVILHLPMSNESNPTHIIEFAPRYIIVNDSAEAICICQNGFQDSQANKVLDPGERTALHAQALPGSKAGSSSAAAKSGGMSDAGQIAATGSLFSIRFCLNKKNLDWSGPVCAAALGSFYIKMRSTNHRHHLNTSKDCERTASTLMLEKQLLQFAVADVQEEASSLIMRFRLLEPENMPYQIQNRLKSASILFHQKGLTESEVLESGVTVAYVWDDLELPTGSLLQLQVP
ncbi:hypothetical protein O6H91_Y534600 [Diphasiastrum complanatum]|nr:hypothetical protein O6H91_Y534600 [Diphasiastrum complanatum]